MTIVEISEQVIDEQIRVVTVHCEKLDLSTAAQFKSKMSHVLGDGVRMVLDLSKVDFVDSSGLGAILSCLRDLNSRGGDLKLCGVQKRVLTLLELVRMHRILGIYETPQEAAKAFHLSGEKVA